MERDALTEGCAGFFTQAELDAGKGVAGSDRRSPIVPGEHAAQLLREGRSHHGLSSTAAIIAFSSRFNSA